MAVALLTSSELQGVGDALQRVLPIEDVPAEFQVLLAMIDEADEPRPRRGR